MKLLIWIFYYNNEFYLEYQLKSIMKYISGYDSISIEIYNDAREHMPSVASGLNAKKIILSECERLQSQHPIKHIYVPQELHTSNNASERHIDCINYARDTYVQGGETVDYVLLMDCDVFLYNPFDLTDYETYAMSGPRQRSGVSPLEPYANKINPNIPMIGAHYNMNIVYPFVPFLLLNLNKLELPLLDFGFQGGIYHDTGSGLSDYMTSHPDKIYHMYDEINVGGWGGHEVFNDIAIHMREGTNHGGLPLNVFRTQRIGNYLALYNRLLK